MPTPTTEDLVNAQASSREQIAAMAALLAANQVRGFTDWYSTDAITRLAETIARLVEALQRQVAGITDAYLARLASKITGRPVSPVGTIDPIGLREGITHAGAYGRLADMFRYEISIGTPDQQVIDDVIARAEDMAAEDVDLAMRAQAQKFMVVRKVDGFRRILHPELVSSRSKSGTPGPVCGLCVAAADRIYHRGELLPLHGGCRCTVAPIINDADPGHQMNQADLEAIYKAAGGTTAAAALKRVKITVVQHGELGPQLRESGQEFRGPAKVRRQEREVIDPVVRARKELGVLQETYARLLAREAAGENVAKPLAYQRHRIAELERIVNPAA